MQVVVIEPNGAERAHRARQIDGDRDPRGNRDDALLAAHFADERERAHRTLLVYALAALSLPLWLHAMWPSLLAPLGFRLAVAAWGLVAGLLVLKISQNLRLRRLS